MPLPMLVELVNGWGTIPRAKAADRDCPPVPLAGSSHAALERVADRLYPVFAADGAAERARLVSELLADCGVRPALGADGDRIHPRWLVPQRRDAVLAAAAVALHGQLVEHEPERLGTCASTSCGDAFADASPGAHRRFCSVTCQNRERVAAFRRRARTA